MIRRALVVPSDALSHKIRISKQCCIPHDDNIQRISTRSAPSDAIGSINFQPGTTSLIFVVCVKRAFAGPWRVVSLYTIKLDAIAAKSFELEAMEKRVCRR